MNWEEEKNKLDVEKQDKLDQYNHTFDQLLNDRNDLMNQQNQLVDEYTNSQKDQLQNQLQHQQDLYNQKKEQADQEYQKEVKAGYSDYQSYINPYGIERENQVQNGLSNTGYSESTKTNAYNTWQLRNAQARATLKETQLQFDNALKEAQLNNDASLAELAYQQLQNKLNNALENFNYKDVTAQNKLNYQYTIDNDFYNRLQNVQSQINYEKEIAEQVRQWEQQMAYQKEQAQLAQQQWEKEYALQQQQLDYQKEQDRIANSQNWAKINASKTPQYQLSDNNNTKVSKNYSANDFKTPTSQQIYKMATGGYGEVNENMINNIAKSISNSIKVGAITKDEAEGLLDILGIN